METLSDGVVIDVCTPDQAKVAAECGANAVMVIEGPAHMRARRGFGGGLLVTQIKEVVSIPVIAKARIGHYTEAMILDSLKVDFIDETGVMGEEDQSHYIKKGDFDALFVCTCTNLKEAFARIAEGANVLRIKGECGTGDVGKTFQNVRSFMEAMKDLFTMVDFEPHAYAKQIPCDVSIIDNARRFRRLPVPIFASGGIASPADAALMMQLGCDGIFIGSSIFKYSNPARALKSILKAVDYFENSYILAEATRDFEEAMDGADVNATEVA